MYQANVDAFLAGWNQGDFSGFDQYVSTDAVRKSPASMNSDANNLSELKQVITDFRTTFPDAKVTITHITFHGDRSYSEWTFEGTNTGPGDFPPTGKSVTIHGASHGKYADGKMVEELVFFDGMDMMGQLGLVPDPSA